MKKITKKHFIDTLITNRSEFLIGTYIRNLSVNDILEHLKANYFESAGGETRQGFKHSNGLKFLKDDGTYSYADNLINYDYYQFNDLMIAVRVHDDSVNLLVYRIV